MCIELGKTKFCFLKKEVSRMSEKILLKAKMPAGSHYPIVDMHFNNGTLQQGVFVKG